MDAQLKKICQDIVNLSDEERIYQASCALKEVTEFLDTQNLTGENKGLFLVSIVKYFVSADKNTTDAEYNLFKKVTGCNWSTDDFFNLTNHGSDPEFMKSFEGLVHSCPQNVRTAIALFGICVIASDNSINVQEQNVLERFLNNI